MGRRSPAMALFSEEFIDGLPGFAVDQAEARACPRYDLIERPKHDSIAHILDDDLAAVTEPVPFAELGRQAHSTIRLTLAFMAFLRLMPTRHAYATNAPKRQETM